MLPTEIQKIFDEYTEDDYALLVTRADYDRILQVDFQLIVQNINDKAEIAQSWTIEAIGHRKSKIYIGTADFLTISNDSPLLWEFTENYSDLYYSGTVRDPAKLFVDLYKTHKNLFGNYQSFALPFLEDALCSGHVPYSNGQISQGPRKLLEHYANCLNRNGLGQAIVGEWQPVILDSFNNSADQKNLQVLFLGDSYIIAEQFIFVKKGYA